jgi:hypothetical protein
LDWVGTGLDWVGLGWFGLGWVRNWIGVGLGWVGLRLGSIGLDGVGWGWVPIVPIAMALDWFALARLLSCSVTRLCSFARLLCE